MLNNSSNEIINQNMKLKIRLKNSLTYLISNGHFIPSRTLIENSSQPTSNIDINETDEWWLLNPRITNTNRKKKININKNNQIISASISDSIHNETSMPISSLSSNEKSIGIRYGRTALMYCSLIDDDSWAYSLSQNLIEKGSKLGIKDSFGYNALMYACFYERAKILELFLNSPGDYCLSSKDVYGNTCFHLAGLCKTDLICKILNKIATKLSFNPDLEIDKNCFGHLPLDLCKLNKHEYCLKRFIQSSSLMSKKNSINNNQSIDRNSIQSIQNNFLTNLIPLMQMNETENKHEKNDSFSAINLNDDSSLIQSTIDSSRDGSYKSTGEKKRVRKFIFYSQLDSYKFIQKLKEPLIKEYRPKYPVERKVVNDYVDFSNKKQNTAQCVITRNLDREQYELIKIDRQRTLSEKRKPIINTTTDLDINKTWKHNFKSLYETFEFQNSRSFRKTNKNISSNLFDQLATGLFLNIHLNACLFPDDSNRRMSLIRTKQTSQLSTNSNEKQQNLNNISSNNNLNNKNLNRLINFNNNISTSTNNNGSVASVANRRTSTLTFNNK